MLPAPDKPSRLRRRIVSKSIPSDILLQVRVNSKPLIIHTRARNRLANRVTDTPYSLRVVRPLLDTLRNTITAAISRPRCCGTDVSWAWHAEALMNCVLHDKICINFALKVHLRSPRRGLCNANNCPTPTIAQRRQLPYTLFRYCGFLPSNPTLGDRIYCYNSLSSTLM